MECKFSGSHIPFSGNIELIDTLWNVNLVDRCTYNPGPAELIDTLWNVNVFLKNNYVLIYGIHRYIMECT